MVLVELRGLVDGGVLLVPTYRQRVDEGAFTSPSRNVLALLALQEGENVRKVHVELGARVLLVDVRRVF